MIQDTTRQRLYQSGCGRRDEDKDAVLKTLRWLGADLDSELSLFYLEFDPCHVQSNTSYEYLQDSVMPRLDEDFQSDFDPLETPIGMVTTFVREVWGVPQRFICLTSTESEGAYLYELPTGQVYDFDLKDQKDFCEGRIPPRWGTFSEFIEWYLS